MKRILARIPPKLLLIMGAITLLGGGSGTAAIFLGTDRLLGPSFSGVNGLSCTTVETVRIRKDERHWIRKYVVTDRQGDGMERLKTALRVAKAVQRAEKPDLVQVSVLDIAGPTERSKMRGRAIGARVVHMSDPAAAPAGMGMPPTHAFYLDGAADAGGRYWGMRVELPYEDAEAIAAILPDDAGCAEPAAGIAAHNAVPAAQDVPAEKPEPAETVGEAAFNRIKGVIMAALFGDASGDASTTPDHAPPEDRPSQPEDAAVKTAN